jgi:hypothetical protein
MWDRPVDERLITGAAQPPWRQIKVGDAEVGDPTTPAFDVNSHHDAGGFLEDDAGTGFSLNNVTAGSGPATFAGWILALPPEFIQAGGRWGMNGRITQVTAAPLSKGFTCGMVIADRSGVLTDAAGNALGWAFEQTGSRRAAAADRTSLGGPSGSTLDKIIGRWTPSATIMGTSTAVGYVADVPFGQGLKLDSSTIVGDLKVVIFAGCSTSLADGPHFGKFLLEIAPFQFQPDDTP